MSNKTILASYCSENGNGKEVKITIDDYNAFLKIKDEAERKAKISEMIYYRFYDRYIKPFEYESKDYEKCYKNGFAMMASGCLLIETFESFYEGLGDTERGSKEMFKKFFEREKSLLGNFNSDKFYKNVRCGILHQAETTEGYKISRKGTLFNEKTKTINATKFLKQLEKCLEEYKKTLEEKEWDSEVWSNCRQKMECIIKNCQQT